MTGVGGAAIQIEPEYRTKIKTFVTEKKVRPITTKERIVVGAKVPASVELEAVPSDWGPSVSKYRYVYSNNRHAAGPPQDRPTATNVAHAGLKQRAGSATGRSKFFGSLINEV